MITIHSIITYHTYYSEYKSPFRHKRKYSMYRVKIYDEPTLRFMGEYVWFYYTRSTQDGYINAKTYYN